MRGLDRLRQVYTYLKRFRSEISFIYGSLTLLLAAFLAFEVTPTLENMLLYGFILLSAVIAFAYIAGPLLIKEVDPWLHYENPYTQEILSSDVMIYSGLIAHIEGRNKEAAALISRGIDLRMKWLTVDTKSRMGAALLMEEETS